MQLLRSVQNNDVETLRSLVDEGADVNARDFQDRTTLIVAIEEHVSEEYQEVLLESGADVNAVDGWKKTPLMHAVIQGHTLCVSKLLQEGADVNKADVEGNTALFYACRNGLDTVLQELIRKGADVNHVNILKTTALMDSAVNNRVKCIEVLLSAGADVNKKNTSGETSLLLAVKKRNLQCIKPLLEAGADLNMEIESPIEVEVSASYLDAFPYFDSEDTEETIIESSKNGKSRWSDVGYVALLCAMQCRDAGCVEALAAAGVDLRTARCGWWSGVAWAASTRNPRIVQLFIRAGCEVNASPESGGPQPLRVAAESGQFRSVQLILQAGADVNRGAVGRNALTAYVGIRNGKKQGSVHVALCCW